MSDSPLSIPRLAAELGLDRRLVARQVKRGCPLDVDGARAWRMRNLRSMPRPRAGRPPDHQTVTLQEEGTHQRRQPGDIGTTDADTVAGN